MVKQKYTYWRLTLFAGPTFRTTWMADGALRDSKSAAGGVNSGVTLFELRSIAWAMTAAVIFFVFTHTGFFLIVGEKTVSCSTVDWMLLLRNSAAANKHAAFWMAGEEEGGGGRRTDQYDARASRRRWQRWWCIRFASSFSVVILTRKILIS